MLYLGFAAAGKTYTFSSVFFSLFFFSWRNLFVLASISSHEVGGKASADKTFEELHGEAHFKMRSAMTDVIAKRTSK
jgi:hypothetical protein